MANGTSQDGALLNLNGAIFLVILGQACGFPDQDTLMNLEGLRTSTPVTELPVPQGPTFTSGACLVQGQNEDPIYLYTWGLAFQIANMNVMTTYGFQSPLQLPPTVVQAMPQGFLITE
jgi:hypothetical protein